MSNVDKAALVPKLRFPEFRGATEWEPKRLADTCLLLTNGKANAQDHEDDGEYPLFDRSAVIKKSSDFMFDAEAVILPGEGMRFVPKYFQGKFNLHQRAYALMQHQGDGRFVYYSLDYFQDLLAKKAVKSTVLSLRLPIVQDFVICCPKSAEQKKIADCLSSLDELIAAQARKVDALKTHKKGLMQQLFPREGETQPRLRFPEFQNVGGWTRVTIGELKPFVTSGSRGWAPYYAEQGDLFVRITNLWRDSIYLDLTDCKYVQLPAGANEGLRTQLKEHDVLISITADIGVIGYVDDSVPSPAYINQHIALVRFNERQLCGKYVAYFLASEKSQRLFCASTDTGTKAGMSLIGIQKIELMLPGLAEQQRIADCLTSLDELITLQARKIDALKSHKRTDAAAFSVPW